MSQQKHETAQVLEVLENNRSHSHSHLKSVVLPTHPQATTLDCGRKSEEPDTSGIEVIRVMCVTHVSQDSWCSKLVRDWSEDLKVLSKVGSLCGTGYVSVSCLMFVSSTKRLYREEAKHLPGNQNMSRIIMTWLNENLQPTYSSKCVRFQFSQVPLRLIHKMYFLISSRTVTLTYHLWLICYCFY